jgi:uncharacterized Zn finger protein
VREGAEARGRRYLTEGRLVVERVVAGEVYARCRGSGAVYALGFDERGWWCSCPARGRCSHVVALQLVTAVAGHAEARRPGLER